MTLNLFEMAALILAATTVACWINANTLKLPVAVGLLIVGLAVSGAIALTDMFSPGLGAGAVFRMLERQIDYPALVVFHLLVKRVAVDPKLQRCPGLHLTARL